MIYWDSTYSPSNRAPAVHHTGQTDFLPVWQRGKQGCAFFDDVAWIQLVLKFFSMLCW